MDGRRGVPQGSPEASLSLQGLSPQRQQEATRCVVAGVPLTSLDPGGAAAAAGTAALGRASGLYVPRAWGWLRHSQEQQWHDGQVS